MAAGGALGSVLLEERRGAVALLTLNRPAQRNSLSEGLIAALQSAVDRLSAASDVAAVVIAANGPAFSSGHDLKEMRSHPEQDSEIINFVAPSYYASGAGGTCPSAEVTAAVAAYIVAASPEKPSPVDIVSLLRKTSTVDRAALGTLPEFTEAAIASVEAHIAALAHPAEGKPRKLDAEGVLNLWAIHEALSASR